MLGAVGGGPGKLLIAWDLCVDEHMTLPTTWPAGEDAPGGKRYPVCIRKGCRGDRSCPSCKGSREWRPTGKPDAPAIRQMIEVMGYCAQALDHGAWPMAGGVAEQSAWFADAVDWFCRMRAMERAARGSD